MSQEMKIFALGTEEYEIVDGKARQKLANLYFDKVADMKENTSLKNGDIVKTLGFHNINDGGGALYKIRTKTENDAEDLGAIHFIGETLVAELIDDNNCVNVNQFGLTNNKYMNDYWGAIYNYAIKKGFYIYFPKGTYKVKKTNENEYIFKGKFISMYGEDATIYCENSCDKETDLFKFVGCQNNYNQFIKGLKFIVQEDYSNIRYFIKFVFEQLSDILYNLQIENNLFGKNTSYAIYTDGFSNGGFNNCQFSHNIVYGLFLKSLSFGDSNKIIGNSLYGSEVVQLNDYVLNLKQTSGSASCKVAENNCTSGLGYFEEFVELIIENNQIEKTEQTNLDYIIKCYRGNNIIINNCNFNAHYNCGLVYTNAVNSFIKNCNYYGCKEDCYLIDCDNAHIVFVEGVRYFDGTNVLYQLDGNRINGHVTNALYDNENYKAYIDNDLTLHIKPKITGSFAIAPLQLDLEGTNFDIPVESIDGVMSYLHINSNTSMKTEKLLNTFASVKLKHY